MGRRVPLDLVLPLALLILLTIPFLATDLDVDLQTHFYREGSGWYLAEKQPWLFLYEYGTLPGLLIGAGALIVLVASIWKESLRPRRAASLFLVLTLAIGPGLIVNTILKGHWGRPRPRDIVQFGGGEEHWKVWERRPVGGGGASLPSGHASVAFYLLTPYFFLRRRQRRQATYFLAGGVVYGVLMGIARMVQGGHFASDVLWAGGIVYLTGYFFSRLLLPGERARSIPAALLLLSSFALPLAGCSNPSESEPPPVTGREESIPEDAVKMTTQSDLYPPVLHSDEWEDPVPMPGPVNTAGAEDAPVISDDGEIFLFFFTPDVEVPPEQQILDGVTGIWWCVRDGSGWSEPARVLLHDDISLDGPLCFRDSLLWFASFRVGNYRTDGDIYTARFDGGRWSDWRNAGSLLNDTYNIGELYATAGGDTVFFHGPSQEDGLDLWQCGKNGESWSEPAGLGPPVNSGQDEGWPWVSPDGREIWFTRWSALGYPGPSLFRSTRGPGGSWSEPEEILSSFAGDPALDGEGNIYFTHHFFDQEMQMIEADIYVARRKGMSR